MKNLYFRNALLLMFTCLLTSCVFASGNQINYTGEKNESGDSYGFCENYNSYYSNGKKSVSKNDLREITIGATNSLEVDGLKNGGISVKGENRNDILIRACVNVWDDTEEGATNALSNTRIETNGVIKASNSDESARYSVSYEILVPRQTSLKLNAKNGGISISSVDGNLQFATQNGGVSLKDVSGDVKGMTKNGGVSVKLSGNTFQGSGLDVETKNGGVSLVLPSNYSADVETGTVNGGFKSDFAELKVPEKDENGRWYRPKKINASINGGGAKIRVVTTNGGVSIKSSE